VGVWVWVWVWVWVYKGAPTCSLIYTDMNMPTLYEDLVRISSGLYESRMHVCV
jgi:hypothetical protein